MSNLSRLREWYFQNDPLRDVIIAIVLVVGAFIGIWVLYCGLLVASSIINDGNGIQLVIEAFRING